MALDLSLKLSILPVRIQEQLILLITRTCHELLALLASLSLLFVMEHLVQIRLRHVPRKVYQRW